VKAAYVKNQIEWDILGIDLSNATNLIISLYSSDPTEVTAPATVIIPENYRANIYQNSKPIDLTDNTVKVGSGSYEFKSEANDTMHL
jgi:hypothetical protein